MNQERLLAYLRTKLSPARYAHSLGVAQTARELAERFGADPEKAYAAGLAHDLSKWMAPEAMLEYALAHGLPAGEHERREPTLLHAKISESLLKEEFGEGDENILSAVRWHIAGSSGMSKLDAVVCLADWIEPGRSFADLPALRETAKLSLELALRDALAATMRVLLEEKRAIHPQSLESYNAITLMIERKEAFK
ncbi:MAG: bis(5'-nucleosyl)-tetraphosphatase (symmetrical) YqeK [Christensenellaceae bacterium]|jgi:predicted HD superfamily hydrolase involved in NAD metabolism|nr:bis(5'-nucleosyl)-tetraphosphatase (symmetrical) YqeK [Christensenellaceae bacterium]